MDLVLQIDLNRVVKINFSRMKRNHIHMAKKSELAKHRINSSVFITIDTSAAIQSKIRFFQSANGVILSPGNAEGIIPANFLKAVTVKGKTTFL